MTWSLVKEVGQKCNEIASKSHALGSVTLDNSLVSHRRGTFAQYRPIVFSSYIFQTVSQHSVGSIVVILFVCLFCTCLHPVL